MLKQKNALAPHPVCRLRQLQLCADMAIQCFERVPDILATKSFDDNCEPSSSPHDTYARNRARPSHSFVGEY